jgi:hypothetical protein
MNGLTSMPIWLSARLLVGVELVGAAEQETLIIKGVSFDVRRAGVEETMSDQAPLKSLALM